MRFSGSGLRGRRLKASKQLRRRRRELDNSASTSGTRAKLYTAASHSNTAPDGDT